VEDLGQLIITGIEDKYLSPNEENFLKSEKISGVILFTHNYDSPAQVVELTNHIKSLNKEIPSIVSVDHEGGRVFRFKTMFTHFPAMLNLSKLKSPKLIYDVYHQMGVELKICGINTNFAPCCDILSTEKTNVIGDRAFGQNSEEVSNNISAAIRGLYKTGIISCAKHFPGLGAVGKDPHFKLPHLDVSEEQLEDMMLPFVKASKSKCEMTMMGHVVLRSLDKEIPCTLLPQAYDLLNKVTRNSTIIVTDDMDMQAITDSYSFEDAAVMSVDAGADLLIYRNLSSAKRALEGLKSALRNNKLDKSKIKDKIDKVIKFKNDKIENSEILLPSIQNKIPDPESTKLLDQITQLMESSNA
jgi:beta-N-acetylhexosaminidase